MHLHATHRNARIAPRKVRWLRDLVVGRSAQEAQQQLSWQKTKAAHLVREVLRSAIANAEHNFELSPADLRVRSLVVGGGLRLKRFQPVSRGMAHPFVKRMSHITVELEAAGVAQAQKPRKTEIETLEVEELGKRKAVEAVPAADEVPSGARTQTEAVPADLAASQKIKTMQQGGDRQKRHRRKSV